MSPIPVFITLCQLVGNHNPQACITFPGSPPPAPPKPRLLDQARDTIRLKHYSLRTEETYVHWIKRFIYFHGKRHPREMGEAEVTAFLNHLVRTRDVAPATQNQALSALLFLYRDVLAEPLAWLDGVERAMRPARVPTVLSVKEVTALLGRMTGTKWLMSSILYGAGLRLTECLTLRVKDVNFDYRQIVVRQAKGSKDRRTRLPEAVVEPLKVRLARVKALRERDLARGYGAVGLPNALELKYPNAARQGGWQYVFPSHKFSADPRSGVIRRHHVYENYVIRGVKEAVREAKINKHVSRHTLRHSYATHLLEPTTTTARCRSCSGTPAWRRR